jgi:FKBP-type peptidyl-prolyl cis-trans isomerase
MSKRTIFSAVLLSFVVVAAWPEGKVDKRNEPKADVSYAVGMVLGYDLRETGITIDYDHFGDGLRAAMEGEGMKLSLDEAMELIQAAFFAIQQVKMAEDLEKGRAFLKDNAARDGVRVTESGLQYLVLEEGDGELPGETDVVRVHYEGRLIDGTVFDSSLARGVPADIPLDAVISGWAEGLQLMNIGSRYRLYVPSELGYGEWGAGDFVPPNSVLIFDIQLLEIVREDEAADEGESGGEIEEVLSADGEYGEYDEEYSGEVLLPEGDAGMEEEPDAEYSGETLLPEGDADVDEAAGDEEE